MSFDIDLFLTIYGDHLSAIKQLDDKPDKMARNDNYAKITQQKAIAWLKDPKITKEKWKSAVNTLGLTENNLKRFRGETT